MTTPPDLAQLRTLQIVSGGMLAAALALLAVGYWYHRNNAGTVEIIAYMAIAMAVLAPVEVAVVEKIRKPSTPPPAALHFVTTGLLAGAAFFCGVSLFASPNDWPLLAAVIPLGMMILRFPRAS